MSFSHEVAASFARELLLKHGEYINVVDPKCPDCAPSGLLITPRCRANSHCYHAVLPHFQKPTWLVSTQSAADVLGRIQAKMKHEVLIETEDGFKNYLRFICEFACGNAFGAPRSLDLVDHSESGGQLQIGGDRGVEFSERWFADPEHQDTVLMIKSVIGRGLVSELRLLGCDTASEDGVSNMKAVAAVLNVRVWGTTRVVTPNDFCGNGWNVAEVGVLCYVDPPAPQT